jgi:hypothetical protein
VEREPGFEQARRERRRLYHLFVIGDSADPRRLGKILIDPKHCETIHKDLRAIGINKTTLFPEAQSVSGDLKRLYHLS